MSESWCAHKIANIEGRRRLGYLNSSETDEPTLQALDMRVRRLEVASNLRLIPPMLVATLESIEYRILQIESAMVRATSKLSFNSSENVPRAQKTLEEVRHVSTCVFATANGLPIPIHIPVDLPAKDSDEAEELRIIAQRLCFIAGWRGYSIVDFENTSAEIYDFAVKLSLLLSQPPLMNRNNSMPHPVIGQIPTAKGCCGCCNCFCHRASVIPGLSGPPVKKVKPNRFRLGGLRNLWCFRRRSTAISIASSTTETLAD